MGVHIHCAWRFSLQSISIRHTPRAAGRFYQRPFRNPIVCPPSDFSGVIAVCPRSQYTIVFSFCQFFSFLKKSALSTNCNNAYCANCIKLRKELFSSLRSPRCSAEPIVFRRLIFLPISALAAGRRSQHKAWTQIVCKKCSAEVLQFEPGSGIIRPRYSDTQESKEILAILVSKNVLKLQTTSIFPTLTSASTAARVVFPRLATAPSTGNAAWKTANLL